VEKMNTAGSAIIVAEVTGEPLSGADLLARIGSAADGAVVVFEGRVRSENEGREVTRLSYDAYREMADDLLREIAAEAVDTFEVSEVAVRHRTGSLLPGEVSLVVAAAAPHRDPALAAARYVIEQLKVRLPVWKKEEYADGSARWLGERKSG
jgi:molybdopterin synthase catalytic subunit